MQGPPDDERPEQERSRYEPPAIEARESLSDPLVGVISGRM